MQALFLQGSAFGLSLVLFSVRFIEFAPQNGTRYRRGGLFFMYRKEAVLDNPFQPAPISPEPI